MNSGTIPAGNNSVTTEEWKPIPGFPDYEASTLGRIKSLKFGKETIKELTLQGSGFLQTRMTQHGKSKLYTASKLILLTFDGPSSSQVRHINGIKTDIRLENLEYLK